LLSLARAISPVAPGSLRLVSQQLGAVAIVFELCSEWGSLLAARCNSVAQMCVDMMMNGF